MDAMNPRMDAYYIQWVTPSLNIGSHESRQGLVPVLATSIK